MIQLSGTPAAGKGRIQRRLPCVDTLSGTNVKLISHWVKDCVENHPACHWNEPTYIPTRVIDVGSAHGKEEPRLLITGGNEGPYVALSHCWGRPSKERPFNRLEANHMRDTLAGISLSALPTNFQDAVLATRKLGLRFLWIDALCIIQDSHSDWEKEAAKMDQVYRHAQVTIVASVHYHPFRSQRKLTRPKGPQLLAAMMVF